MHLLTYSCFDKKLVRSKEELHIDLINSSVVALSGEKMIKILH